VEPASDVLVIGQLASDVFVIGQVATGEAL